MGVDQYSVRPPGLTMGIFSFMRLKLQVFLVASQPVVILCLPDLVINQCGHGSKARTPSENPNPHKNRLKWVVHLPEKGSIGFDPQPCEES